MMSEYHSCESRTAYCTDAPVIRIDKVHSAGQIWFEASILFPDGRASSTYPKATSEEAEKAAYRIISYRLIVGFTPCDNYEPGSGVVESKIVEFEPEKLGECPIGMDCAILTGVKFPCPNFKTCRIAFQLQKYIGGVSLCLQMLSANNCQKDLLEKLEANCFVYLTDEGDEL